MKTAAELAAEQAAYWNGPGGEGWLAAYQRIQRAIGDIGDVGLAAAAPQHGEHVIDIGCGTGDTTAALARAVGLTGHVLGVDISEPLITAARSQRLDNATFVVGDAATHPFQAGHYELVFSRFGVMFFADPVAAFRNIRRALKPAGRLVFIAWRTPQENPWGTTPVRAAQPFLPPQPRPGPEDPGQFAFGDRARVERILGEAGFKALRFEPIDRQIWMGDTVAEVVAGAGKEPAAIEKAKQAIAEVLTPHEGSEGVRLPGACWLVRASAN
jgi:SAM-dependent methyltransferase